jgi:hypothetical protein
MATERQRAANRANAQRSTGPKSHAGKKRASQNAYRHGLSACILLGPDWITNVEDLAREIVDSTGGQIDHARSIAHAQLEVLRVRSISTAVVTQILADRDHGGRTTSADRKELAVARAEPENESALTPDGINRALAALKALDRYERRAISKRRRIVRHCLGH